MDTAKRVVHRWAALRFRPYIEPVLKEILREVARNRSKFEGALGLEGRERSVQCSRVFQGIFRGKKFGEGLEVLSGTSKIRQYPGELVAMAVYAPYSNQITLRFNSEARPGISFTTMVDQLGDVLSHELVHYAQFRIEKAEMEADGGSFLGPSTDEEIRQYLCSPLEVEAFGHGIARVLSRAGVKSVDLWSPLIKRLSKLCPALEQFFLYLNPKDAADVSTMKKLEGHINDWLGYYQKNPLGGRIKQPRLPDCLKH